MPIKSMIKAVEEIRKRLNERRRSDGGCCNRKPPLDLAGRYGTIKSGKGKADGAPIGNHNAAGSRKCGGGGVKAVKPPSVPSVGGAGGFSGDYPGRKNIVPTGDLNILKNTARKDGGPGSAPPKGNQNAAGPHKMGKSSAGKNGGGQGKKKQQKQPEPQKPYVPELKGRDPNNGNPIYSKGTWEFLSKGAVSFAGVNFKKKSLEEHKLKHGPDGDGTYTEEECRNMDKRARELLSKPVGGDIDGYARENGMIVRYNRKTQELASGMPGRKLHTIHKLNQAHTVEIDGEQKELTGNDYFDFQKAQQEKKI